MNIDTIKTFLRSSKPVKTALGYALIYALAATIWIVVSDQIALQLTKTDINVLQLQTYKDMSFVLLTALFLFGLLYRQLRHISDSEKQLKELEAKLKTEQSGSGVAYYDEDREIVESTSVSHVITHQKKINQQLQLQSQLLQAVQQAVIATDLEGRIIYWNDFAEHMYGWKASEAKGKMINNITVPDISIAEAEQIMSQIRKSGSWSGEFNVKHKDGRTFPAFITNSCFYDENGNPAGIIGLSTDISMRIKQQDELRATKNYLSAMFEASPAAVVAIDENASIKHWNPAAEKLFGWLAEEVIDRPIPIIPEDKWDEFEQNMERLKQSSGETDLYVVRKHKDGTLIGVSLSTTRFTDPDNEPLFMAVYIDISDRLRLTKELENTKNLLERIFESLTEVVFVIDANTRTIVTCNPAIEDMFGYSPEEVIGGNTAFLHISEESYHQFGKQSESILKAEGIFSTEYQMRHKDGTILDTEHTVTLLIPEDGLQDGAVSVIRDITARKQMELQLREGLRKHEELTIQAKALQRSAEALVHSTQLHKGLLESETHLATITNYSSLVVYEVKKSQLVAVTDADHNTDHTDNFYSEIHYENYPTLHAALTIGHPIRLPAVEDKPLLQSAFELSDDLIDWIAIPLISREVTLGLLCVSNQYQTFSETDLAILHRFSYQIASALDNFRVHFELQKSYIKLENIQRRSVEAARLAAIGELAAGVAHQINNPLMTVIADSHLLLKNIEQDSPMRESTEAISRAAHRAGNIVQRLLDFARTSPEKMDKLDINESLQGAIDLIRPQIEPRYAKLEIRFSDDLPLIDGSEEHLQDVWMNLLLNARDAVREVDSGIIRVITGYSKEAEQIIATIEDNGLGIEEPIVDNIFDPFFTTKEHGTGLGLSICFDIIKQHHGTIKVKKISGGGTRFIVSLPAK